MDRKWLWDAVGDASFSYEEISRRARINANHGKRCSCSGCGNPRSAFGRDNPTMQEKKENERYTHNYFDDF